MARWHPSRCKTCGKRATPDEHISAAGYCLPHGIERMHANNTQLNAHSGPFFDHWLERLRASVGVTLDEPQREP